MKRAIDAIGPKRGKHVKREPFSWYCHHQVLGSELAASSCMRLAEAFGTRTSVVEAGGIPQEKQMVLEYLVQKMSSGKLPLEATLPAVSVDV